jgi:hypothetical protein
VTTPTYRPQALWYGMIPIFLLGGAMAYARLHYMWKIAMKFKHEWREGVRFKDVHRFREAYDVEIVSRVMRVWEEDDETLDPEALDLAETIYKVGSRHRGPVNAGLSGVHGCKPCCQGELGPCGAVPGISGVQGGE